MNKGDAEGILILSFFITFTLVMVIPIILTATRIGIFRYDRIGATMLYQGLGLLFNGLIYANWASSYGKTVWALAFTSGISGFASLVIFRIRFYKSFKRNSTVYRLTRNKSGVETVATIVAVRDTNWTENNRPVIRLELEYSYDDETFTAEMRQTVGFKEWPRVGGSMPILLDPVNPEKFGVIPAH